MATVLQNAISVVTEALRPTNASNFSSELSPADFDQVQLPQDEKANDIVNMCEGRFKDASNSKLILEREWLLCEAFARDNQWVEWRDGQLQTMVDPNDPYRTYNTDPQIAPLLKKIKSRATMSKPDASVKPLTPDEVSVEASKESRDILTHYDNKFDRQNQTLKWVDGSLENSTTFLKIFWDPNKEVLAPVAKNLSKYETVKIGDIDEYVVSSFEIYPDPQAREWESVSWLIHAKIVPLTYIQERFGKRGMTVEGKFMRGDDYLSGYAEQRQDSINGYSLSVASTATNQLTTTLYEMWEKPSRRYPKGRLIKWASGVLLTYMDWPYDKRDDFPFVPLAYEIKLRGLWSRNAVSPLIPLQREINNTLSRIGDRVNTDKPTIMIREGAEIGVSAYTSTRNYEKIYYVGEKPEYQTPPDVNPSWFEYIKLCKSEMENIAGVHEISNGSVPAGVTAGNAIELLQQSDTTQMSEFITSIEQAQCRRAEWEIALCAQFYDEPRLISVSTLPNKGKELPQLTAEPQPPPMGMGAGIAPPSAPMGPQGAQPAPGQPPMPPQAPRPPIPQAVTALMAVRSFWALKQGARVKVEIVPGSATPKTPAARSQQVLDLFKAGAFQAQNLPSLVAVMDLLNLDRSDELDDRLQQLVQKNAELAAAMQPDPIALQQAQAAAQQQHQAMQQQHDAAILHAKSEASQMDAQIKGQLAAQESTLKSQHDVAMEHAKNEDARALLLVEHQINMEMARLNMQLEIEKERAIRSLPPAVSLSGKLDPTATVDAEKAAGYDGKIPPVPAPASKSSGASAS